MSGSIAHRRAWGKLLRIATVAGLALLLLVDAALVAPEGRWLLVAAGLLASTAALAPWPLTGRAAAAAACSWVTSIALSTSGESGTWGLAESAALLLLIVTVSRSARPRIAVPLALALGGAVAVQPFRFSSPGGLLFSLLLTVAVTTAIGFGSSLRWGDQRRERDVWTVRQDERLDLARELHDFVAHHVTGIVVQAQAAQVVAAHDAEAVTSALGSIERAGTEALASMRQLVGVLRGDSGGTRPGERVQQLAELVDGFARVGAGPVATLDISPDLLAAELSPGVVTTVHRVVQESLTNVRQHALSATDVRVSVQLIDTRIQVCVRDNGNTAGQVAGTRTGFGLVGLSERLESLGGTLRAGPRVEGGWEVVATLPIPRSVV